MEMIITLFRYLVLYIIIQFGSIYISEKFNKKIENCIVVSLLIDSLIMYVFGICKCLVVGIYIVSILNLVAGVYVIAKKAKNKTLKELEERILSKGNLFFTFIYFVFIFISSNIILTEWDQYTYWSYVPKVQFLENQLLPFTKYSGLIIYPQMVIYPPMPSVLQYYFMKIIGGYSQGIEFFTMIILVFSTLISIFEINNKNRFINFCKAVIIVCIPAVFPQIMCYMSSYPDCFMAVLMGYVVFKFFIKKEENNILEIALALSIMSLMKATGFYIALIIIFSMLIKVIMENWKNMSIKEFINNKNVIKVIFILFCVICVYGSWTIVNKTSQKKMANEIQVFEEKQNNSIIQRTKNSIIGLIYPDNQETYNAGKINSSLIEVLFTAENIIMSPVKVPTYGVWIGMLIIGVLLINSNKGDKDFKKSLVFIVIIGILYLAFLQVAYLFKFSEEEALKHAGFARYISTYLIALFIFIMSYIEKIINEDKKKYAILTLIIIMLTPLWIITNNTIAIGITNAEKASSIDKVKVSAEKIRDRVGKDDKIYILDQEKESGDRFKIRYYLLPTNSEVKDMYKIEKNSNLKIEQFEDILKRGEYEYIYVINSDDYLNEFIKEINNGEDIQNDTLYKIEKTQNKLEIKAIK